MKEEIRFNTAQAMSDESVADGVLKCEKLKAFPLRAGAAIVWELLFRVVWEILDMLGREKIKGI